MKKHLLILILHSSFLFFHSSLHAQWSELGGLNGLAANYWTNSVCSDASGNIYAGGKFTNSSGKFYVAKWDGTAWSELGGQNGLAANDWINSVCSDASGNIYAGGYSSIARWGEEHNCTTSFRK